ncbi:unnamed protein product [Toxocara canis]|uniref:Uncharacterized protein n=1 Tax=Toxocara canis TaxID=6265 RepID=A0A183TXC4_TOXCA|nr:unnamed protein product [Toxocara canis]
MYKVRSWGREQDGCRFATSASRREACAVRAIKSVEDLSSFHIVFNDFLPTLTNDFDEKVCPRHFYFHPRCATSRRFYTPHLAMRRVPVVGSLISCLQFEIKF